MLYVILKDLSQVNMTKPRLPEHNHPTTTLKLLIKLFFLLILNNKQQPCSRQKVTVNIL